MYNPFSVYTVIPWAILFNVSEAVILALLDAMIGEAFNDAIKACITLILFIVNFVYIIYTIGIHMSLFYRKYRVKCKKGPLYPVTFLDLFNLLISASLIWVWLFMSLYFFDHATYSDVLSEANQPHTFYKVYLKFYAYALMALNGSGTTIFPLLIVSELAQGLASLYYQVLTVIILSGLLSYLLDLLHNDS